MFSEKIDRIRQKIISNCVRCGGTGFMGDKICSCNEEFRVYNRLLLRGFPEEYLFLDEQEVFKNIKLSDEDLLVLDWYFKNLDKVLLRGLSLYIYSEKIGIGKTSLAICIAKVISRWCLSEENYMWDFSAFYLDINDFIELIKNNKDKGKEKEGDELIDLRDIEKIKQAKLVIIDEFGRESLFGNKEWILVEIERFLRFRIANNFITILCSNVSPSKLSAVYGERLASLVGITGKETIGIVYRSIELKGSDLRRGLIKSRWEL